MRRLAVLVLMFVVLTAAPAFADEPGPNSGDGPVDELIEDTEPAREFAEQTAADATCDPAPECGKGRLVQTFVMPAVMMVVGEDGVYGTTIKPAADNLVVTIDGAGEQADETTHGCGLTCDTLWNQTADGRQTIATALNAVYCSDWWGEECAEQWASASFGHCTGVIVGAAAAGAARGAMAGGGGALAGGMSAGFVAGVGCIIAALFM